MSSASKQDVEALHRSFARTLKDMLADKDKGESAAFLQVVRQFIHDQGVTCSVQIDADSTPAEMAEELENLQEADFPSFTQ